jgi:hypothetical protein
VAAGADGLIVEVHPQPKEALSDGDQSLTPELFARLVERCDAVARAVGRRVMTADDASAKSNAERSARLDEKRGAKPSGKPDAKSSVKAGARTGAARRREERWPA